MDAHGVGGRADFETIAIVADPMILDVIQLMKISFLLLLVFLAGCNASSQNADKRRSQTAVSSQAVNAEDNSPVIFAVPRPNSGTFSTIALMPQFFNRSTSTSKTDPIVTQWKSPTQGIRIHISADDSVEIVDFLGRDMTGVDSISAALDSTMTLGNERSVLLTSETDDWDSPTKNSVIDALFHPSIQIYLVGNDAG